METKIYSTCLQDKETDSHIQREWRLKFTQLVCRDKAVDSNGAVEEVCINVGYRESLVPHVSIGQTDCAEAVWINSNTVRCLPVCLCVCLSVCLCVCLSICLCACLSICATLEYSMALEHLVHD